MDDRAEVELYSTRIVGAIDRLLACLNGLNTEQLNWKPPVAETNSLAVLATHTMANAEENVIEIVGGESVHRVRDDEFVATTQSSTELQDRWSQLRQRIETALAGVTRASLDDVRTHARRGTITVREVLLGTATHAAEHVGQAELTRQLLDQSR